MAGVLIRGCVELQVGSGGKRSSFSQDPKRKKMRLAETLEHSAEKGGREEEKNGRLKERYEKMLKRWGEGGG